MIQLVPFWNRFIWKDFEWPTLTIYFFALKSDKKYSLYTFFQKNRQKSIVGLYTAFSDGGIRTQ